MQNKIRETSEIEWKPTRPNVASGVFGHQLLPRGSSAYSISLTRVRPGGKFAPHTDQYHHIFYFIEGTGLGTVNSEQYMIEPGLIVEVESETSHSYENTGTSDMLLLTINLE